MHEAYIFRPEGAKTALVCIHGILGTPRQFDTLMDLVPPQWAIYNILLDGHGGTPEEFSASGMSDWKEQVTRLTQQLLGEYDQVVFCGHSMGTLLSLEMALLWPDRIPGLFLMAAPLRPWMRLRALKAGIKAARDKVGEDEAAIAARRASSIAPDRRARKYLGWIPRFWELLREARRVRRMLPALTTPTVAVQSAHDELVRRKSALELIQWPTVRVWELQGSSHFAYSPDDLETLRALFSRFCREVEAQSAPEPEQSPEEPELLSRAFSELSPEELYKILKLRVDVFVVEQNCPYPELDGLDQASRHLWLQDGDGQILAYLRLLPPGLRFEEASLGRVVSLRRRQGLATRLLRAGIEELKQTGADAICIEAQVYARQLYEKLGFQQCSEEFLEDGIPHIQMRLEL